MLKGAFIGFGNVAANGHCPDGAHGTTSGSSLRPTPPLASRGVSRRLSQWPMVRNRRRSTGQRTARFRRHLRAARQPCGADRTRARRGPPCAERETAGHPTRRRQAHGATASRARRVVHTVHNWLEAPICRKISALIDESAIGAVRSVRWRTLRTQPAIAVSADGATNWRVDPAMAGGGILFDHGWHALYCVTRWAGAPIGV